MARKKSAGRIRVALALALIFGPASLLVVIGLVSARSCEHKFKQLPDLGPVAEYSFTDVNGNKRTSKDFEGDIVLATTIQTTCPNDCAISLVILNLQVFQLAKNMEDKSVKIISFVTDQNGDPVEDISHVQDMLEDRIFEFDPEIWILASGSAKELFDLKQGNRALLDETGDEFYAGQAYLETMLLIDRSNHLRMIRAGTQEGMIREMKQHIALLQKQYDVEKHGKGRNK
jgi:protein SCO1/2